MTSTECTAADVLLAGLKKNGVDFFFANAGTDFPPIVESLAQSQAAGHPSVHAIICPHENAAMSMAHGYTMVTGRPQAVMVHVNVGTANAIAGLMNAERERIPILLMAGRTPLLERGEKGSRTLNIHWAQEMFDQGGLVREFVRWDYELRDARQTAVAIDRALAIANSEPQGPVYLSLPREVLAAPADPADAEAPPAMAAPLAPLANPRSIAEAAAILAKADSPLIVTASTGRHRDAVPVLARFAEAHAIPVVEFRPRYLNLPARHPMHWGYEVGPHIASADAVLVLDCDVPWIPALAQPSPGTPVINIGADPLFARYPLRGFPSAVSIAAPTGATLTALDDALAGAAGIDADAIAKRRRRIIEAHEAMRAKAGDAIEPGTGGAMSFAYVSKCLGEAAGGDAVFVNEYPLIRTAFDIDQPGGFYGSSPSGALGWGLPAALGAKLALPERLVVAALGDGSHLFANPAVCHQISAANDLPILTVVFNNRAWAAIHRATGAMYPDGAALKANRIPLSSLEPAPAYEQIVEACGGWGIVVEDPDALPGALSQAIEVVTGQGRQALVNVICR